MNRTPGLILAAVAIFVPASACAEATLYGRINNALVRTDFDDPAAGSDEASADGQWDVEDNSSRLGVKGSEELGDGIRGIFQIELQMETSDGGSTSRPPDGFGTRLGYAGLSGGLGTLSIGRQWTPYRDSVHKTEGIWNLADMEDWYLGEYRQGNMIIYTSPGLGGFGARLATITDGDWDAANGGKSGVDWYNASLDYNKGPLSLGLSYMEYLGEEGYSQAGLGARYLVDNSFGMFATYEVVGESEIDGVDLDLSSFYLMGEYYFSNNILRFGYGSVRDRDELDESFGSWSVGLQHNFSKRTRIFVEYQASDNEQGSPSDWSEWYNAGAPNLGHTRFGVGLRHDF